VLTGTTEEQAEPTDHTRQDGARIPQLDGEPQRAEHQQQVGDLRVRDGTQHALASGHLQFDDARMGGVDGCRTTVEACDGCAIQLFE